MINKLFKIKLFLLLFIFSIISLSPIISFAEDLDDAKIKYGLTGGNNGGVEKGLGSQNIVKKTSLDLPVLIGKAIGYVLSFIGTIFMIAIIYGGFLWMTAKGNESQVDKAKTIMRNSIIGFVVVALAYVISTTVLNALFDIAGVTE